MQAAIASLLELDLNDVPNFITMPGDYIENITEFFESIGFNVPGIVYNKKYLTWYSKENEAYEFDLDEIKKHEGINGYFFAGVLSPTYFKDKKNLVSHAIVIDSTYVHNLTQEISKLRTSIYHKLGIKNVDPINPHDFSSGPSLIIKSEFLIYYNSILLLITDTDVDATCSICKQQLNEGIMCGCGYWYHYDHLIDWLIINNNCPVCKHKLSIVEG